MVLSMAASRSRPPTISGDKTSLTLLTAFNTPLPSTGLGAVPQLTASYCPVDARRDTRSACAAVGKLDFDLHGRVASRIQYLSGVYVHYCCHPSSTSLSCGETCAKVRLLISEQPLLDQPLAIARKELAFRLAPPRGAVDLRLAAELCDVVGVTLPHLDPDVPCDLIRVYSAHSPSDQPDHSVGFFTCR